MKTTGTIEAGTGLWYAPNTGATNSSGFTALPGGHRYDFGGFCGLGYYAYFWSSTECDPCTRGAGTCITISPMYTVATTKAAVLVFVAFRIENTIFDI